MPGVNRLHNLPCVLLRVQRIAMLVGSVVHMELVAVGWWIGIPVMRWVRVAVICRWSVVVWMHVGMMWFVVMLIHALMLGMLLVHIFFDLVVFHYFLVGEWKFNRWLGFNIHMRGLFEKV
jgi:hypothetical protein